MALTCEKCSSVNSKVKDSRTTDCGNYVRRRRACLYCGFKFTTYEVSLKDKQLIDAFKDMFNEY